jgi:hypothetical protein
MHACIRGSYVLDYREFPDGRFVDRRKKVE